MKSPLSNCELKLFTFLYNSSAVGPSPIFHYFDTPKSNQNENLQQILVHSLFLQMAVPSLWTQILLTVTISHPRAVTQFIRYRITWKPKSLMWGEFLSKIFIIWELQILPALIFWEIYDICLKIYPTVLLFHFSHTSLMLKMQRNKYW